MGDSYTAYKNEQPMIMGKPKKQNRFSQYSTGNENSNCEPGRVFCWKK